MATALALCVVGCNRNVHVQGTVTFNDGAPLTVGEVLFESNGFVGSGRLDKNGSFRINGASKGIGIPAGDYGVSIVGTEQPDAPLVVGSNPNFIPLVHSKYKSPSTSEISIEVKRGMKPVEITVEPSELPKPRKKSLPTPKARPPGAPR